jgi:hypothetical protein
MSPIRSDREGRVRLRGSSGRRLEKDERTVVGPNGEEEETDVVDCHVRIEVEALVLVDRVNGLARAIEQVRWPPFPPQAVHVLEAGPAVRRQVRQTEAHELPAAIEGQVGSPRLEPEGQERHGPVDACQLAEDGAAQQVVAFDPLEPVDEAHGDIDTANPVCPANRPSLRGPRLVEQCSRPVKGPQMICRR